jgi:hypothetical protein
MDNTDAPRTHSWSDGDRPREIKQDSRTILHHRCRRCARDFVQGLDGSGWHAAYIGLFKVELLADSVNERWLTERCPEELLSSDQDDRAMRRA